MGNEREPTAAVRPASQLSNRAKQIAARATPDKSPNDPNYELQATLTEKQPPAAEESKPGVCSRIDSFVRSGNRNVVVKGWLGGIGL
jgi:hypothetical protein